MVILCDCTKGIRTRLDVHVLQSRLRAKGQKVLIEESPCRNGFREAIEKHGANSVVLGGCYDESYQAKFRYAMRNMGLDPFAFSMVNLSGESSLDRATLLLSAAVERLKLFSGTKESNLKPRFARVGSDMSRRQFFTVPRVQYDLVPSIENELCRSKTRHCRLCSRKCSQDAIVIDQERTASIDKDRCDGCGICAYVCPAKAIVYPYFTPAEMLREVEALLERDSVVNSERRALLFVCRESASLLNDYLSGGGVVPEGILPVIAPSIGMLNSFTFLHSFFCGAFKIGLLPCNVGRHCSARLEGVQKEIAFTQAVLTSFNIDGERLVIIRANSPSHIADTLEGFYKDLDVLMPIHFSSVGPARKKTSPLLSGGVHIPQTERNGLSGVHSLTLLLARAEDITGQKILFEDYPSIHSGDVRLRDNALCTFCGVCGAYCPTSALSLKVENGTTELMFNYKDCIACGECVRRCPEKILRVKKLIDTERLRNAPEGVSLAKEDVSSCKECGTPFINKALLKRLKEKAGFSDSEMELINMCPDCRANAVFVRPEELMHSEKKR